MSWLEELGIDEDRFHWIDLATCQGLDTKDFFEGYETSNTTRAAVDEMCSICPVRKQCLLDGIDNKDVGVRGGWYLDGSGSIDKKNYTNHKTPEQWDDLRDMLTND